MNSVFPTKRNPMAESHRSTREEDKTEQRCLLGQPVKEGDWASQEMLSEDSQPSSWAQKTLKSRSGWLLWVGWLFVKQYDIFVKLKCYHTSGHSNVPRPVWQQPLPFQTSEAAQDTFSSCRPHSLIIGRWSPALVMGYWPFKLELFGLPNHLRSTVTLTGLSLTHSSLWYLKGRPLVDHNFFISTFHKKRSQQGKIWACVQPDETSCLNNRHLHRSQTKETAPTHLVLTSSKSRGDGRDTAGLALHPQRPANVAWEGLAGESKFCEEEHWILQFGNEIQIWEVYTEIIQQDFNYEKSSPG